MRSDRTPAAEKIAAKGGDPARELGYSTWAEWFRSRYGEDLDAYAQRARAEGIGERIRRKVQ